MILCEAINSGYWLTYKPVTPTGRWRIRTHPNMDAPIMDIEVKGRWFRRWLPEYRLDFRPEDSCIVNECGKEEKK